MKSLNEDIKSGQLKQVYLLYGAEDYLKRQFKEKLIRAIIPGEDTMNLTVYEGKGIPVNEAVDLAGTMPFFAEKRLIVFENSNLLVSGGADLAEFVKTMPDTACFLFVEREIDKRSKLYKAICSKGRAVEMKTQNDKTLQYWIKGLAQKEKKIFSDRAIQYFLAKCGSDMGKLQNEFEKLACYCMDRAEITENDIDAVCVSPLSNKVFDMIEAVSRKEQKKALSLYYDLLALNEKNMRILSLIERHYRILYHVKELQREGRTRDEISTIAGIQKFTVAGYLSQAAKYSAKELLSVMEEVVQTEEQIKNGLLKDSYGVELFLVKHSGKNE